MLNVSCENWKAYGVEHAQQESAGHASSPAPSQHRGGAPCDTAMPKIGSGCFSRDRRTHLSDVLPSGFTRWRIREEAGSWPRTRIAEPREDRKSVVWERGEDRTEEERRRREEKKCE